VTDLRGQLARRFEIGAHPLRFLSEAADSGATRLTFATATGERVRGFLIRPDRSLPAPVVLVIHAHGARYGIGAREILDGRPSLVSPVGPLLAEHGYAVLCLDMPCFGDRAGTLEGPAAKAALWQGRSLAGQMLGECHAALTWALAQDWCDGRAGIWGLSMGATLGYWLAAVDPRVSCLIQLCCFADLGALIATGAHDLHGPYMTVPGLVALASAGTIAGLVAPRPQFVGWGDADPLTPPGATEPALTGARAAYAGGPLTEFRAAGGGHAETPAMRTAWLDFLRQHLPT
jgi:pimeloyl-ACP methyl ester carboxylesterase